MDGLNNFRPAILERAGNRPLLLRFKYRIRVSNPITLTNYSGWITNTIAKKMLSINNISPHLIQVSPLATRNMQRYITKSPYPLTLGVYEFIVTTYFKDPLLLTRLVKHSYVEIENERCSIEGVEFQPIILENLRYGKYPECFYLIFRTPTRMGKKLTSIIAGKMIYELLPTPTYIFGTLATIWNKIADDTEMKIDVKKYVEWVKKHVIITPPYKLKSYTIRLKDEKEISGFVGKIGYRSAKPETYEHAITIILARLSQYTGIGLGRKLGMGITKYIES